jgi:hypothetical protein
MAVALGDARQDGRLGRGLVREDEQQADGVLQQLVLPPEIGVGEQRLDLRAVLEEVAVEGQEENSCSTLQQR